jgi:predicted Ser/Thr protein kinase
MPSSLTCPEEPELLAVAAGDEPRAELRNHLAGCSQCRDQVERYQVQMEQLRAGASEPPLAPSTMSGPGAGHGVSSGQAQDSDRTAPREAAEVTAGGSSAPETELGFAYAAGQSEEPPHPAAIGKYLVIGRFPPTGQAEVFRVVHPQLRQERVIKLAKEPVGADGRSDIIEEGRILADLDHPNMVRVYEADFHEDRPYLVMEYIRGRSLKDFAGEHPLSPRQAAALVAKVCAAAEIAHRRGVVHRDIKPLNILIDDRNEPRLIDFGLARSRTFWSDGPSHTGGTFAFMAPEQARVESPAEQKKVGPRSDVFALGAVLYFLLTGKAPFDGRNWRESMDRARRNDFDQAALDNPKVPRELRRLCLKAMAAEPGDRFASAQAFQQGLERYLRAPKVRSAVAGVVGLVLIGVLGYRFVIPWLFPAPSLEMKSIADRRDQGLPTIPKAVEPLKGRIDLLVVASKDGKRRRLRLEDPGSVPVQADDQIRIEARLDRPAYLYLFWISSDGQAAPLYPWEDRDWSKRPAHERKVTATELPDIIDKVWEIPASPPGLETLVLLAREDSPLPREEDSKLAAGLSGTLVSLSPKMKKAVWIEDGEEVVFDTAGGSKKEQGNNGLLTRGIPSKEARKSDDAVLGIRRLLQEKVQPLGSYSQAVLFPNDGGS